MLKSAISEVKKTLRNGPRFAKISRKPKNQPFFEGEKSLDMGRGSRPRAAHPSKNNSSTPPAPAPGQTCSTTVPPPPMKWTYVFPCYDWNPPPRPAPHIIPRYTWKKKKKKNIQTNNICAILLSNGQCTWPGPTTLYDVQCQLQRADLAGPRPLSNSF